MFSFVMLLYRYSSPQMNKQSVEYLTSQTKRRLDVMGGIAISAMLLPAAAVTAAISEVDTKSINPFFRQTRVGLGGKLFDVVKFRTLPKTANTEGVQTFGTYDPRASRIGRAIREVGIDEMPQLLNVLRGEMSLVGMRPLLQEDLERLEGIDPKTFKRWHEYYQQSKPGLTGPSQIYRHQYKESSDEVWVEAMRLDLEYASHASLRNDLKILGGTPLRMLNARVNMVDNTTAPEAVPEFPEPELPPEVTPSLAA
jgi:lipopolysaccharide/colanic/teichoic acid biosynthesis glycosyltransferase